MRADRSPEQLGGLVVEVRNAIRAVREKLAENALGLNKAAQDSARFGRYLGSVLAALREVDRQVLSSDTLAERLRHYFEDFVERGAPARLHVHLGHGSSLSASAEHSRLP